MDALQKNWNTPTLSESSVLLIGILLTIVGLTFRDTAGITSLLAAVGIGLVIAGTVYIAVSHAAEWGTGDSWCRVERYVFDGSRREIKRQIAERALEDLHAAVESA